MGDLGNVTPYMQVAICKLLYTKLRCYTYVANVHYQVNLEIIHLGSTLKSKILQIRISESLPTLYVGMALTRPSAYTNSETLKF